MKFSWKVKKKTVENVEKVEKERKRVGRVGITPSPTKVRVGQW